MINQICNEYVTGMQRTNWSRNIHATDKPNIRSLYLCKTYLSVMKKIYIRLLNNKSNGWHIYKKRCLCSWWHIISNQIVYNTRIVCAIDATSVKKCRPRSDHSSTDLGLHSLHMFEGPFSHDAGHIIIIKRTAVGRAFMSLYCFLHKML